MKNIERTVGFKHGERNVFFHILTACNLACRHCYINKVQHGSETLPIQTIKKWLKLFASSEKKTNCIFLGGEPTLHPALPDAVRFAKNLGYNTTIDSNGYLFHEILDKVAPEQLDFLSFSLDGPNTAINDPIRGKGVFVTCTENIKRAVKKNFNVSVIYTVSEQNLGYLNEMAPLLTALGVKKFFIQVIGLRGNSAPRPGKEDNLQVSRKDWLAVVPAVARDCAQVGIHVTYPKVFLSPEEKFECAGLVAENYFIFPNGRVYMCPLCEDYPVHAYSIIDNRLIANEGLSEQRFFSLNIPEGCVMNRMLQPDTIEYNDQGNPIYRISCCLLKQEVLPF